MFTDVSLESFVPLVDHRERAQLWKWIAQGRDPDDDLGVLCEHWQRLRARENADREGVPTPPPRR